MLIYRTILAMIYADISALFSSQTCQALIFILLPFAFFYLVVYSPEKKRRKALNEQISKMKPGNKVIAMGIVGVIKTVKEDSVVIKTINSEIEVLKGAITYVDIAIE